MTSIEWLIDRIAEKSVMEKDRYYIPYNSGTIDITHIIEQAKEMHKQEMAQLPQQEILDEEIEKEIKSRYETPHYNSGFMDCAKWYREQLKQRQ